LGWRGEAVLISRFSTGEGGHANCIQFRFGEGWKGTWGQGQVKEKNRRGGSVGQARTGGDQEHSEVLGEGGGGKGPGIT